MNAADCEAAARHLCAMRGHDPDERVGHDMPNSGMWHYSPRWWLVADRELAPLAERMAALAAFPPLATAKGGENGQDR